MRVLMWPAGTPWWVQGLVTAVVIVLALLLFAWWDRDGSGGSWT